MTHKTMKSNGKHTNRPHRAQGSSRDEPRTGILMLPKEILTRVTAVQGTG
jgi:hypothetical protein